MSTLIGILDAHVDIFVAGAWQPMGSFADPGRLLDNEISISVGGADLGGKITPSQVTVTLANEDGRLTPKDPRSPWWPDWKRGAFLRVWVGDPSIIRFWGKVTKIVPTWPIGDQPNPVAQVEVTANGQLHDLDLRSTPLRSALVRHATNPTNLPHLADYYPMEDGRDADGAYSGLPASGLGFKDLPVMSTIGWSVASDDTLWGSEPLPNVSGGADAAWNIRLSGRTAALSSHWVEEFVVRIPEPPNDGATFLRWDANIVGGSHVKWTFTIGFDGTNPFGRLRSYNALGDILIDALFPAPIHMFGDFWITIRLDVAQAGPNINWTLTWSPISPTVDAVEGGTSSYPGTCGHPVFARCEITKAPPGGLSTGHVMFHDGRPGGWLVGPDVGWQGEMAHVRWARLCTETGVPNNVQLGPPGSGLEATTQKMGAQRALPLSQLLQECADTDGAIFRENAIAYGVVFQSAGWRYNQPYRLTLDAALDHIANPFTPTDDDQGTVTSVKASRIDGASFTLTDPDADGVYEQAVNRSLFSDFQVAHQAGWALHQGQDHGLRYSELTIDLGLVFELHAAWTAIRVGSRIRAINLPDQHYPDNADLHVAGWTETIRPTGWVVNLNAVPAVPWTVAVWDHTRYQSGLAFVTFAAGATDTAIQVGSEPWTTNGADFPMEIIVGDSEVMTLTGVSGPGPLYTFSVIRNVNGLGRAHPIGTKVRINDPAVLAL